MHLNEYVKAVAYFEAQHALAISLKLAHVQSDAALKMGVALTLHVRAAPGPFSLQAAFDGGDPFAHLHLAHLTYNAGREDAALAHLKEHLSWRVQRGRDTCAGCGQARGEDTPMLTCSGCRVARFCSADHQKMASKKAALGGSLTTGGTRISAECSASGARLSKTVWRLTRALRTWWRFCSDECTP